MVMDILPYLVPKGVPVELFVMQFLFAIGAATVRLAHDVSTRDVNSRRSPVAFSMGFFVRDNALRLIAGALVIYYGIYFITLFIPVDAANALHLGMAVVVGATSDILWRKFEKWSHKFIDHHAGG